MPRPKNNSLARALIPIVIVVLLLSALTWRYYYGPLLLSRAAMQGDHERLKTVMRMGIGADADGVNTKCVFHAVVAKGDIPTMLLLFDIGGASLIRPGPDGLNPLQIAIKHDQYDALHWLLEHKADPTVCGRNGQSPLQYATELKRDRFVTRLQEGLAKWPEIKKTIK